MSRLTDPVYRRRALEFAADALLAAAAFALAFKLRFLDVPGRDPRPLRDDARRLGRVRRARQGAGVRAPRPAPEVVALLPAPRPLAAGPRRWRVASALLVARVHARPSRTTTACRARSSSSTSCSRACCLGGARLARRLIAERPARRARERRARDVLVVGAGSGGQMVVRELQLNPNLGARAIGFVDDDPAQARHAHRGAEGARHDRRDRRDPRPARARRGRDRDPVGARRAARQGRRRVPRARHPGAHAADRVRAPARRRPAHPPAARGPGRGRARPRAGRDGARPGRRLPGGQASCWSPAPAARSAPSSAARSRGCGRACWCCSTTPRTTSSRSTAR